MASEISNRTVVVKAIITAQRAGKAKLMEGVKELGQSEIQAPEFKQYPDGTIIECHFSVSSNGMHRQLVWHRVVSEGEKTAVKVTEDDTPARALEPFPEWIGEHFFDEEIRYVLSIGQEMMKGNEFVTALMRGGSGYGKTTTWFNFARHTGLKFLKVDCSTIMDPEAWFGINRAKDGTTTFAPTDFTSALREGGYTILFDEINRLESWLANTLFPILDDSRFITIGDDKIVAKAPLMFAMSINEGIQFSGTFNLDAALRNRADISMIVKPLPEEIEIEILRKKYLEKGMSITTIKRIVNIIRAMRRTVESDQMMVDVSTRTLKKVGHLVSYGATIEKAFTYVVINNVDSNERKAMGDILKAHV